MPDIKGKKINQLDDGKAVVDPLFVLSDQDGKAYNMGIQDLNDKVQKMSYSSTELTLGTNINSIITPGVYKILRTDYNDVNYPNAPYFDGMLLSDKLGDVYLIVEQTPGGVILQHMHVPFSDYAIFSRTIWPQHQSNVDRSWFISWGAGVLAGEIETTGELSTRSIRDLSTVLYEGIWSIYLQDKTQPSNRVTSTLLNLLSLPVPVGFTSGYPGYNFLKVEYVVRDYASNGRADVNFRQTIFYSKLSVEANTKNPLIFTRTLLDSRAGATNDWKDETMTGIGGISNNAARAIDNKLAAGTATIPSLVFTPGVQVQNPIVKGSLNYDGTDFYYTDDAGNKRKITSTIV